MAKERPEEIPVSFTAIGLQTGLGIPGLSREEPAEAAPWLEDVRGPLEEALATGAVEGTGAILPFPPESARRGTHLPHSGSDDPWDGP